MDRVSFGRLFDGIIMSCQQKAKKLEGFESGDGCIRISYLPQNTWAANILESEVHSADRFELTARIMEGGNYILNRHDKHSAPIDSYAFSALKVAACLRSIELGLGERSGYDLGDLAADEEHGFATYRGAICYSLYYEHRIFALLIVSVSGASAAEDEKVAEAGETAIDNWCRMHGFSYEAPPPITPR